MSRLLVLTYLMFSGCFWQPQQAKPPDPPSIEPQQVNLLAVPYPDEAPPPWVEQTWLDRHPVVRGSLVTAGVAVGAPVAAVSFAALFVVCHLGPNAHYP